MKGIISIYLLIILMLSGILVLSSFQEILSSLIQIKFYFHQQRASASNQNELFKLINELDFNPHLKNQCIENKVNKLCYLNNTFAGTEKVSFPNRSSKTQSLIIDFNYYQRLAESCQNLEEARTQLEWDLVNPKTCIVVQPSKMGDVYYNFNLALEDLKILTEQLIFVSGYTTINKLTISKNVTIISLGEIIVDDLIMTENAQLNVISIRDNVRIRQYPEEAFLISQNEQFWQIGLNEVASPIPYLKILQSIAVSLNKIK